MEGGAVLREKGAVGAYSEGGILVPRAVVCVQLDLLVTGVCSQARSASCASSSAQLQWVTWREVDTEVSGGTGCMTARGHKCTQI